MASEELHVVRAVADFDAFYRSEFVAVVALAVALTRNRAVAEELAQEAFLRAHRRWSTVGRYQRPDAWVRRVVANLATSRFRRLAAESRALMRAAQPTSPRDMPPDATAFWEAVRRLPSRQAQVVALHYADDRSVAEIAVILGTSEGTVKTHLHRARGKLAGMLDLSLGDGT